MERPGIMAYFSDWLPLLELNDTELAGLFRAVIRYGKYGEIPEFSGLLNVMWSMIRPKIDNDGKSYEKQVAHARYMAYKRKFDNAHKGNEKALDEEDWLEQHLLEHGNDYQYLLVTDRYYQSHTGTGSNQLQYQEQDQFHFKEQDQDQSKPHQEKTIETAEGDAGGCKGEVNTLYAEWNRALDSGNMDRAYSISNELYRLEYDVNKETRELTRRL